MLIVLTYPQPITDEHDIIHQLFEQGLETLHIYKPNASDEEIKTFINQIAPEYQKYCVIHEKYKKFHSLAELHEYKEAFQYAFLSPIFDSISKIGYKSPYQLDEVKRTLHTTKHKIIALGGIDENKIDIVKDVGFYGIAVLGAIWQHQNPVEKFKRIQVKWTENSNTY